MFLLLSEKPVTTTASCINQFAAAEFSQESIQLHMPCYSKQKCQHQGCFFFRQHKMCSLSNKWDLQINYPQYKQNEMQFNSATNGWRWLFVFYYWGCRTEEDTDGADHSGTVIIILFRVDFFLIFFPSSLLNGMPFEEIMLSLQRKNELRRTNGILGSAPTKTRKPLSLP